MPLGRRHLLSLSPVFSKGGGVADTNTSLHTLRCQARFQARRLGGM